MSWGWFLYAFSPSVPLLAADEGISDAQAGLHGTAMAIGGLLSAFFTPRAVLWWGRRGTIVGACLVLAAAIGAFLLGPSLPWTLGALFVVSLSGNVMFSSAQVGLALHHGPAATAVITEGNGLGTAVGLLAPLSVGVTVGLGWGWRPAVLVASLGFVVAAALVVRQPVTPVLSGRPPRGPAPSGADPVRASSWRPGRGAWLFLGAVVAAGGVETAMTYWSPALVAERTGAGPGIATAAVAGVLVGMSAMRFVIVPLALRVDPTMLLAVAHGVAIVGWAVVWSATSTGAAFVGLVLAGLGMGGHYPLAVSLLLAAAEGHSDRAQAYSTLFGALSVAVSPFLLGALSDEFGMHPAFVVVPAFALLGAVSAVLGGRVLRRAARADVSVPAAA